MDHASYSNDMTPTVVITVGVAQETVRILQQAVQNKTWPVSFSPFDAYISATRRPSFAPLMKSARACIAFVDFDRDKESAIQTTKYLLEIFPQQTSVVALAHNDTSSIILDAMRAGCTEFMRLPIALPELEDLLHRIEKQWLATHAQTIFHKQGSLVTFFGAKGGVGTTTLAAHVAMYLAVHHKKKTLLIDHHAELGHICVYLGIDGSRFHFQEVVRNVSRLDSELLRGFVARHKSGLDVLASPDSYGEGQALEVLPTIRTLDFLRGEYDYVLVDSSLSQEEGQASLLDASSQIYLVTTPEIGAVRDLSRYVDKLMLLDHAYEKVQVVVNRASAPYAIHIDQIEAAIKLPVAIRIPNNYQDLVRAGNLGEPIAPTDTSEFSAQVTSWANMIAGNSKQHASPERTKRLFGLWK